MTPAPIPRRSFVALAVLACLVGGAALGAADGLWSAWVEIGEQQYAQLGFTHTIFEVLCARGAAGVLAGARWGLGFGAAAIAVALASLPFPPLGLSPRKLTRLLASRAGLAGLVATVALASNAALALVERDKEWLGAADVAHALLFALVCAGVLACLARTARAAGEDEAKQRAVAAALAGFAALAAPAFWIHRATLSRPLDPAPWLRTLPFVLGAGLVYAWIRVPLRGVGRALATLAGLLIAAPFALRPIESAFGAPTLRAERAQNVVFLGIDTLRADATSLYGSSLHGRDTTPNLRKLAERGVLFENAHSQAPWTLPAFASMFTGKYPHEHGAYSLSGVLRPREVALAEVLRECGYESSAAVAHSYVDAYHGLSQGFERFDESNVLGHQAVTGRAVTDLALGWIEAARERPFFVFAHYFDPHYEYVDHAEWPWADGYSGWLAAQLDFDNLEKNRQLLEKPELDFLVDRYEEEIAYTDREIGRLLERLGALGRLESTWIVVVGDHGEEFLERGGVGHTTGLHEEQVHVPLLVVPPLGSLGAARVARVVETRDVFGTLLARLGVDFAPGAQQRDLLLHAESGADDGDGKAFSIVWLPDAQLKWGKRFRLAALRDGNWKLIRDYTRDRALLYDLAGDPRERHDLSLERPEIAQRLRATLETWVQEQQNRGGAAERRPIDKDLARKLEELGYL